MRAWEELYVCAGVIGLAVSLAATPVFRRAAGRIGLVDRPRQEAHKGHPRPVPLLGGAAMFTSLAVCVAGAWAWERFGHPRLPCVPAWPAVAGAPVWRSGCLALGAFLATVLGLLDDLRAMKAWAKFSGQFVIALIAVLGGGAQLSLFCPWAWAGSAASVLWFMLLMNSINFFDNMDGLAAGAVAIAMAIFAAAAAISRQHSAALLAALVCGVCCGFWFYNRAPASIFMGDSGSHLLGYLTAAVSCLVTYFRLDQSLSRFPVLLPLLILAIPLFDTAAVVIIRCRNRRPFWIGDHNHISHRFVKMGLSRKRAVQLIHLMVLATGLGALPILRGSFGTAAILVCQAVLLLLIVSILQFSLDHGGGR